MHFDDLAQWLWQGMAVQKEVGRVQLDVVARHIPDALVLAALAPRVLHHVVGLALLVDGLAVDEHHVVVGEAPVVPLLLTKLLSRHDTLWQHGQTGACEVARHVAAPSHRVACIQRPIQHLHQLLDGNIVTSVTSPFLLQK